MSAWVNPSSFEGRNWAQASIGGWGEPERGQKPHMGLSYLTITGRGQPRFHLYGFDPRCASPLPRDEWRHVALAVSEDMVRFYLDGVLEETINNNGELVSKLGTLRTPVSTPVDLGDHGNGRGPFNGALDEVRFESAARSDNWLKLCYENQKPLQSLVGPLVQDGEEFSVSKSNLDMKEGESISLSAKAGGARKVYWVLKDDNREEILAVDRFNYTFNSGRVAKDKLVTLLFKGVFESGVKTRTIPITIQESVPDPSYALVAPKRWNGRDELVISPLISNLEEMKATGTGDLNYSWKVAGMATISESSDGKLILKRAQNSGLLTVELTLDNGGAVVSRSVQIEVLEPKNDAWVKRILSAEEKPVDHQFYARDDKGKGTLHYRGLLQVPADSVFLKLYVGNKLLVTKHQSIDPDRKYSLSATLKAGLITYRTEFGVKPVAGRKRFWKKPMTSSVETFLSFRASLMQKLGLTNASFIPIKAHGFEVLARRVRIKTVPGTRSGAMPCLSTVAPIIIVTKLAIGESSSVRCLSKGTRFPSASSMGRRVVPELISTSAMRPIQRT